MSLALRWSRRKGCPGPGRRSEVQVQIERRRGCGVYLLRCAAQAGCCIIDLIDAGVGAGSAWWGAAEQPWGAPEPRRLKPNNQAGLAGGHARDKPSAGSWSPQLSACALPGRCSDVIQLAHRRPGAELDAAGARLALEVPKYFDLRLSQVAGRLKVGVPGGDDRGGGLMCKGSVLIPGVWGVGCLRQGAI
jgi:hypothetical protein